MASIDGLGPGTGGGGAESVRAISDNSVETLNESATGTRRVIEAAVRRSQAENDGIAVNKHNAITSTILR